jgi:hypothetical protein
LCQRTMVASIMLSPSFGITSSKFAMVYFYSKLVLKLISY